MNKTSAWYIFTNPFVTFYQVAAPEISYRIGEHSWKATPFFTDLINLKINVIIHQIQKLIRNKLLLNASEIHILIPPFLYKQIFDAIFWFSHILIIDKLGSTKEIRQKLIVIKTPYPMRASRFQFVLYLHYTENGNVNGENFKYL